MRIDTRHPARTLQHEFGHRGGRREYATPEKSSDGAPAGRVVVATVHVRARFGARAGALAVARLDKFHLSRTRQETRLVNTDVVWRARTGRAVRIDENSCLEGVLKHYRPLVVGLFFDR